jgi:hypothetical protein
MRRPLLVAIVVSLSLLIIVVSNRGETPSSVAHEESPIPLSAAFNQPVDFIEETFPPTTVVDPAQEGIPEIQPRFDAGPGEAAFTKEDVLAYVLENPHPAGDTSKAPIVVRSIELLTGEEIGRRFREEGNYLSDRLYYLVTFSGYFVVFGIRQEDPEKIGTPNYTAENAALVFDAQTGHLDSLSVGP